ncbi:RsiV family protein [Aquimarina sp. AU474]|uniref:RsiV family protein n=1 Tax=Aquimarina sp. AU474 TaxID=2108529 RepID=UPI000D6932E4|nr:RsiV family protein [Aquimarina sp. AU474]
MKKITIGLIFLSCIACKNDISIQKNTPIKETENNSNLDKNSFDSITVFSEDNLDHEKTKELKRERLIKAKDDKPNLQELVVTKSFFKEEDQYLLDYRYPYLNEKIDPGYQVFNNFIQENYLDIKKTENEILEDKELLCDTLKIHRFRDKRIIDYKVYNTSTKMLSTLLYKENYYSGMRYSTYLFDCVNFDLEKHSFVYFNDFFVSNAEEEIYQTINSIISENITSGEFYLDCWELSRGDFKAYKNNFVVNDSIIEFYFDDCVICPSYTGTYSVEIPIKKIMHLIKKYNEPKEVS